jgi:hypothetical protein
MRIRITTALLTLGLSTVAHAQQATPTPGRAPAPPAVEDRRTVFCNDAVNMYRQAANITSGYRPTGQAVPDGVNIMTRQVYRSGAMERILQMGAAARCDLAPFLMIEKSVLDRIDNRGASR